MADEHEKHFHYGGQAVIEGVMMRGKKHFAVACRRANGEVEVTSEHVEAGILGKLKWLNKPFLRGTLALVDSLTLGMKSLMWSANIAMEDEQAKVDGAKQSVKPEGGDCADAATDKPKSKRVNDATLGITMFFAMGIAVLIFMFLPIWITKLTTYRYTHVRILLGLTEGGIKLVFFFAYVWAISRMKDIKRVFQYHGAEHKTINAFESGEPLTVENVQKYSTVHVRCGTSFLMVVVLVSIIVFTALPWQNKLLRLGYKLLLLPLVAGIAYEIIKFAGSRKESRFIRMILGPGLLMQRLTTQPPSDEQVEVAIKSFEGVRAAEAQTPIPQS